MMKKKILTTTVALFAALGLAGCSTNATSTTINHEPQATKVAKATSHKSSKKSTNTNKSEKATSQSQKATNSESKASSTTATQSSSKATLKAANAATTATSNANGTTTAASKNDNQVLNGFMAQSGVKAEKGNQYIVTNQGKGQYQVEVRDSNGDPNISHLDGLYQYNTNTNHVSQMNVTTGQFN